jgi:glycosyltransferase involved in cell wall biosynthesis
LKKILLITNHYLPGYKAGGPIKSIVSLCNNIHSEFELFIMTSDRDSGDKEQYSNIKVNQLNKVNNENVLYLSNTNIFNILKYIKEINPDIIHLNSFFSKFTQVILFLNKFGFIKCKIILSPRGELSKGALSIKANKKKYYFNIALFFNLYEKNIIFHATDNIEKNDINKYFKSHTIYNIPNLTTSSFEKHNIDRFANVDILKFVFISRISRKKNLDFALNILLKYTGDKEIIFDIYGTKEDIIYWNECQEIINKFQNNVKVNYISSLKPNEVTDKLKKYHIFFLPTKNENFGHAIVEAMQAGTIPLISDQTPWNDLDTYNAGWSLKLDDENNFVSILNKLTLMNSKEIEKISLNSVKYINSKLNTKKTKELYISMYNEL